MTIEDRLRELAPRAPRPELRARILRPAARGSRFAWMTAAALLCCAAIDVVAGEIPLRRALPPAPPLSARTLAAPHALRHPIQRLIGDRNR